MKTVEKSNYRKEPCNLGKPEATASSQGGVESSPRRALWSATKVKLIRQCRLASLRVKGEAQARLERESSDLTSHGKGGRWEAALWLSAEREESVTLANWRYPRRRQSCAGVRAVIVAQASWEQMKPTSFNPERRRLTTAGAKDGRKVKP